MKCPPVPPHERERLAALQRYWPEDERPIADLTPVVQLAARIFNVSMSAANIVGSDHVFFAASAGIGDVDRRRDVSFCAHTILQDEVMVVPDAERDERFHDNPLVLGEAGIRFYAGVPLLSPSGEALGVLCVLDRRPRKTFSASDRSRLTELARMAMDRLELHRIGAAAAGGTAAVPGLPAGPSELARLARMDGMTGLPNRRQFYRSVEATLIAGHACAILMLDLDGFKDVNNILGPAAGDDTLRAIAGLLLEEAGSNASVARVGGDEFAVQAVGVGPEAAEALARRLLERISTASVLSGETLDITACCGISLSPRDAGDAVELIGNADLALHAAKVGGSGAVALYSPVLRTEAAERCLWRADLHRAVSDGELLLFYQPQVRLSDGALVGAEALIRWLHPTRGLLSPAAFLPALEAGPLAPAVGRRVLDEGCAQAARWRRLGARDLRMAINLFGAQFRAGNLTAQVEQALRRHGLPPEALELEITENIVLSEDEAALEVLSQLRRMGVGIAFDDFGTGYASLILLSRVPVSCIKIDRSFVEAMLRSPREAAVIGAILELARTLEMDVIAEGIETEAECSYLRERRCPEGQGYLFGKPMPAPEFESLIAGRAFSLPKRGRRAGHAVGPG